MTKSMPLKWAADRRSAVCGVAHTQTFDYRDKCAAATPWSRAGPLTSPSVSGAQSCSGGCTEEVCRGRVRRANLGFRSCAPFGVSDANTRDAVSTRLRRGFHADKRKKKKTGLKIRAGERHHHYCVCDHWWGNYPSVHQDAERGKTATMF